jgi:hypothetical protein
MSRLTISNAQKEEQVRRIYAEYDQRRKFVEAQKADAQDLEELKALEEKIKKGKS